MVKIINAFREDRPVGQVLANLGSQLFGDMASGEINRQQAYALQRSNAETDNLMNWMRTGQNLDTLSPDAAAMLLGSGYSPADFGRIGNIFASTNYGARDDRTTNYAAGLGEYGNTAEAYDLNLAEIARNNNLQSADRRYGVDQNVAEDARQFNLTPQEALVNGEPAFVPRSGAFKPGVAPIMTDSEVQGFNLANLFPELTPLEQRTAVGAAPSLDQTRANEATRVLGTPGGLEGADPTTQAFLNAEARAPGTSWNYITPDGQVYITNDAAYAKGLDAQGRPLPPDGTRGELTGGADALGLTNAVRTDLQSDLIATDKFNDLVGMMLNPGPNGEPALVDQPENFGVAGWVQSRLQELAQGVGGLVNWIRPQDASALAEFLPEIYNPNLTEVQTLGILLLYQGAAALAGQQGRSVSDADIRLMRQAIPNPFGIFTSAQSMRAALETARNVINGQRAVVERSLSGGAGAGAAPAAAPVGGVPAGAPTAINPDTGETIYFNGTAWVPVPVP